MVLFLLSLCSVLLMKHWFKLSIPAENSWMQNSMNSQETCNCSSCIVSGCNSLLRSVQIKMFACKLIPMGENCGSEGVCGFTAASSAVQCCRHPIRWTILVLRLLGAGRHRIVLVYFLLWILSCRSTLSCIQLSLQVSQVHPAWLCLILWPLQ